MTAVRGTEGNTRLGYTASRRSRAGTHTGLWCGGTARCCAHTVDKTGCSGARRSPENKLQCGNRGEGSSWQGEVENLYQVRVIKEFWTTRDQKNLRKKKTEGAKGWRTSKRVRLHCKPQLMLRRKIELWDSKGHWGGLPACRVWRRDNNHKHEKSLKMGYKVWTKGILG